MKLDDSVHDNPTDARTSDMSRRQVLGVSATAIAGVVGVGACIGLSLSPSNGESGSSPAVVDGGEADSGSKGDDTQAANPTPQPTQSRYAYRESGIGLYDLHWEESQFGNLSAAGTAVNLTNSMFEYVQITVVFVDASGAQLETGLDNTTSLAAGQKWRYAAMYPGLDTERVANAYTGGIDAY